MSHPNSASALAKQSCGCCGGLRQVESYDGQMRPCSRCRGNAFLEWSKARREAVMRERAAKQAAEAPNG